MLNRLKKKNNSSNFLLNLNKVEKNIKVYKSNIKNQ